MRQGSQHAEAAWKLATCDNAPKTRTARADSSNKASLDLCSLSIDLSWEQTVSEILMGDSSRPI